jgi:hypothetical protein
MKSRLFAFLGIERWLDAVETMCNMAIIVVSMAPAVYAAVKHPEYAVPAALLGAVVMTYTLQDGREAFHAVEADMSGDLPDHDIIREFQGELSRFIRKFGLNIERSGDDDCLFHPKERLLKVALYSMEGGVQVRIGSDEHNLLPDGRFTNPESPRDRIHTQDLFGRILIHLQLLETPGGNCA